MQIMQITSVALIFFDISSVITSMYLGSICFLFVHTGTFGICLNAPVWVSTFFVLFLPVCLIFLIFTKADLYLHFHLQLQFFPLCFLLQLLNHLQNSLQCHHSYFLSNQSISVFAVLLAGMSFLRFSAKILWIACKEFLK